MLGQRAKDKMKSRRKRPLVRLRYLALGEVWWWLTTRCGQRLDRTGPGFWLRVWVRKGPTKNVNVGMSVGCSGEVGVASKAGFQLRSCIHAWVYEAWSRTLLKCVEVTVWGIAGGVGAFNFPIVSGKRLQHYLPVLSKRQFCLI